MKKIVQSLLFVSIFCLSIGVPAMAENHVTVLENGLRVLVLEDKRFPLVSVRLYVHAGGAYEDPKQAGISHLLEHMVFRGTGKRPDGVLTKEIESVGGDFNAYTSTDETVYYTDLPAKEWRRGIDVVADMALNPVIDPKIMEEEKKVVYAEMGQRREDPQMRLYENTLSLALEGSTYMHGVLGTKETVGSVTVADMKAYMERLYNPQNMLLVVVGDVQKAEVLAEAQKHFSARKNVVTQVSPSALSLPLFQGTKLSVSPSASSKVLMNISFPVPSVFDMRSRTFELLQMVLGGLDTSVLTKKFELDSQLVNSISSYTMGFDRVSLFTISVDVEVDKVEAFWKAFVPFLAQLSTKEFTQTQVDTAKFLFEQMVQRRKSTVSGYAALLGDSEFANPGEFSIDNYLHAIKQVNMEDLDAAMKEWLTPDHMAITVLAPQSAIDNKKLPDFLAVVEQDWSQDSGMTGVMADAVYYKSLLPKTAKIIEENEKRIVIEYGSGSKVILLPDATMPFLEAELKLVGGSGLTSPKEQGLSAALAAMLGVATEQRDRQALSTYLAERAISISAANGRETFSVSLSAPTQFQTEAFALLDEVVHKPAFAAKDWTNIHNQLLVRAKEREEEPGSLLFAELLPTVFTQKNAYGYVRSGMAADIENFTLEQVKALWAKQKDQAWIFTIAGDFRLDRALQFVEKLTVRTEPIKPMAAPTWQEKKDRTFTLIDKDHEYIMQIFPTVPYENKDAVALAVLKNLLGDMSGILFQEVREKRSLAYQVEPIEFSTSEAGFLAFYVNTALSNGPKILPAFQDVITDLQENLVDKADIDSAVLSMEMSYIKGLQRLSVRVAEAANNVYLGRPFTYYEDFFQKAKKITPQDVQRVVKKYLKPQEAYVLKVTSK